MVILYLDTSCLLKLYLYEAGSEEVQHRVDLCHAVSSSWIAYTEMHSALTRRMREGAIEKKDFQEYLGLFQRDWGKFSKLVCDEAVSHLAGDMAVKHRLRGMDAIHLASAVQLRNQNASVAFEFLSADVRLNEAAKKEGFRRIFKG